MPMHRNVPARRQRMNPPIPLVQIPEPFPQPETFFGGKKRSKGMQPKHSTSRQRVTRPTHCWPCVTEIRAVSASDSPALMGASLEQWNASL